MKHALGPAALFSCLIGWSGSVAADELRIIDWSGLLYRAETDVVEAEIVGSTGVFGANSLASDSAGVLYTIAGQDQFLFEIDPVTAEATPLFRFGVGRGVLGIALSPANGFLYAIVEFDPATDVLYAIDFENEVWGEVGQLDHTRVQSLAFAADGRLLGWDVGVGLIEIDPRTGASTDISDKSGGTSDIQTIEFTPEGELWAARSALYKVDPQNAGYRRFTPPLNVVDARGMAFLPRTSGLHLEEPSPGEAGVENVLTAVRVSEAGHTVAFVGGLEVGGTRPGPICPAIVVGIAAPILVGKAIADEQGIARLSALAPDELEGERVLLQAIDVDACERSNLVGFTFQ